jgi:hypothetical protein
VLPVTDTALLPNPFKLLELEPCRLSTVPSPLITECELVGGDAADATERYDRSCLNPRREVDNEVEVREEGDVPGGEGPMTTKRREHFRDRMCIAPWSSWIVILLISGSLSVTLSSSSSRSSS